MTDDAARYNLTELANLSRLTPRTIRYYISQGLLRAPVTPGPGPKYTDADLARLRLIRRLQRDHQPLAEIRSRLAGMDDEAVLAMVESPEPPKDSALAYIRRVTSGHVVAEARAPLLMRADSRAGAPPVSARDVDLAPPVASAPDARLERSTWERIALAPDIELHVRRPLPRPTAKRVDRIVSIARDLLEEEPQ